MLGERRRQKNDAVVSLLIGDVLQSHSYFFSRFIHRTSNTLKKYRVKNLSLLE